MIADITERISGKWRIVEMAFWDRSFLDLCGPAVMKIDARGGGNMAFGAVEASLRCHFMPSGLDFNWTGTDEGEKVTGDGWANLQNNGCLEGEIAFHNGDETTFTAVPWTRFSAAC